MASQYDEIGLAYESLKALPAALVERANLRAVMTPLLQKRGPPTRPDDNDGVSVLDLACGTGYYSRLVLTWGASRVVGVDISPAIIEAARSPVQSEECSDSGPDKSRLTFEAGDCTRPLTLTSSPARELTQQHFDVVLGAWLLNYALCPADLVAMFTNVSSHLNPGGRFVGIVPYPAPDLDAFAELFDPPLKSDRNQGGKYGVTVSYASRLPGGSGYRTKVTAHVKPREFSFESFHLRRDV